MGQGDAQRPAQRLPAEMPGAAHPGGAVGRREKKCAGRNSHRLQVAPGLARSAPKEVGCGAEGAHGGEAAGQGVGQAGMHRRIQHQGVRGEEEGQPVRQGARNRFRRDGGGGADAVLHHHRLPPGRLEAACGQAADEVGRPAGRVADQQPHRAVGPGGLGAAAMVVSRPGRASIARRAPSAGVFMPVSLPYLRGASGGAPHAAETTAWSPRAGPPNGKTRPGGLSRWTGLASSLPRELPLQRRPGAGSPPTLAAHPVLPGDATSFSPSPVSTEGLHPLMAACGSPRKP